MLPMAPGPERMTLAMRSLEASFLIGVEGVTEIWLVRHGDCYEDMSDGADPPLSPLGRQQAQLLAKRVSRLKHAAVYSSPYRRALETASAISNDVLVDDRLIEMKMDLGDEGELDFKELPASAVERMSAAISDIAQAHPDGRVIVVTHGAVMIMFLTHVLRLEPGQLRFLPYFTSVNVVRMLGDRQMVGTLGDTSHLE
jgi:probable phosphoglycerate mutase